MQRIATVIAALLVSISPLQILNWIILKPRIRLLGFGEVITRSAC